jgi:hypothetical protein
MIISDRVACGSPNKEHWRCGVFLTVTTSGKGRLERTGMSVWKIFSDEEFSLDLILDLEAWFLKYLNSDFHIAQRWWSEIGQLKDQDYHFIFFIWYNHFNMQFSSNTSSQDKKSSPLLQAARNQWQKHAQQSFSSDLMWVSVPAEDRSQQSSTFTHANKGPVLKYSIMLIKDQYWSTHSCLD